MEGFNMELGFASLISSFAALARGNANLATLSIGLSSPLVPPLPGCLDGPEAGGLGKHGRFEGDVSTSRQDAGLGDQVNFSFKIFEPVSITCTQFSIDTIAYTYPVPQNHSQVWG